MAGLSVGSGSSPPTAIPKAAGRRATSSLSSVPPRNDAACLVIAGSLVFDDDSHDRVAERAMGVATTIPSSRTFVSRPLADRYSSPRSQGIRIAFKFQVHLPMTLRFSQPYSSRVSLRIDRNVEHIHINRRILYPLRSHRAIYVYNLLTRKNKKRPYVHLLIFIDRLR